MRGVQSGWGGGYILQGWKYYKIDGYFQDIRGTNNFHARGKFLVSKEMLDRKKAPSSLLFIGDTNMDMAIARKHKAAAVGLTFGHQSKGRFKKSKNVKLVGSFKELGFLLLLKLMDNQ